MLVMAGRELPHAMMMMIPEPWENHESMDAERRAFYEFHSCLMEPWDGPASMAFTDGKFIGACLDRNGLRPSRYYVTKDDVVIMASEAGVLPVRAGTHRDQRPFAARAHVSGGSSEQGRIIADEELKKKYASAHALSKVARGTSRAARKPAGAAARPPRRITARFCNGSRRSVTPSKICGSSSARWRNDGVQPLGSMGTDTPLAVFSNKPQLLYNYFKQLFAQVTNPPIDPIREEIITSTETMVGGEGNMLEPTPESCAADENEASDPHQRGIGKAAAHQPSGFQVRSHCRFCSRLPTARKVWKAALEQAFHAADKAIADGANILILSDRGIIAELAPIPALLAVAGLHHHLIRTRHAHAKSA